MRLPARTSTTRLLYLVAIISLALGASATALDGDSESEGIFSESSTPGTLEITDSPAIIRYRYVEGLEADHPAVEVVPHPRAGEPEPFVELRSMRDVGHLLLTVNPGESQAGD